MSSALAGAHRATLAVVLFLGAVACEVEETSQRIEVWTWSEAEGLDQTERLARQWSRAQPRYEAKLRPWPVVGDRRLGSVLLDALDAQRERRGRPPALLEVPDTALSALIAAERAQDLTKGGHARRLGLQWDDFVAPLMPGARRGAKDGIVAIPHLLEAPLFAVSPDAPLGSARGAEVLDVLLEAFRTAEGKARRPLAVAADHRALLALLEAPGPAGGKSVPRPLRLDSPRACRALGRLRDLSGGSLIPPGRAGEERALEELGDGRASAAWIWSGDASTAADSGGRILRAPGFARGTYWVVHAGADWGSRQGALRLARWMTEPQQTAELALALGTLPVRRSAADGALYSRACSEEDWRAEAALDPEVIAADLSPALMEALISGLERAAARDRASCDILAGLQGALGSSDE